LSITFSRAAAAALLACAFPALCAAQGDAPVARPEVKVGDRWTYQRMNYDAGVPRGKYEMRVVFAERGVIQVVSTDPGKEEGVDTTYTAEWNAVTVPGRVINPHTGWFRFPLQVGATYKAAFEVLLPKQGEGAESRNEREVRVVGWEEVVVPAGKLRALKILSEGRFHRLDKGISGSSRNVIWYVPEVKRWVKITAENRPPGGMAKGRGEYSGEELVDYKLQ
jgi:hypothetical protein